MDKRARAMRIVNISLSIAIVLMVILLIVLLCVISPMQIVGESMYPTLHEGDRVWVQRVGYELNYGDVVVFERPDSKAPPIKRILAMEGDVIRFDAERGCWFRNGVRVEEPYLAPTLQYIEEYMAQTPQNLRDQLLGSGVTVGEGELFVLGDNRNNSYDSHNYGCIRIDWLKGKAKVA